ncbi:MAG: UDP-glucose/GDP-mannose dehydrogenase family protein [Actinomycetota bacterium]
MGDVSNIGVIGAGYVGLTTAACFAKLGHRVVCADIDADKIARLNAGEVPILEHGMDDLLQLGLSEGNLEFVVGAEHAAATAEFAYLCVPTPQREDGSADLSYIEQAAREIADALPAESIVVNKSTVPVGSTRVVEAALGRPDVSVVSNPEFLREGSAVHDFFQPDRIVIGADDRAAAAKVASLYLGIPAPIVVTDPRSAETIKYAANAFLATKLSFANAIAAICEGVGADVHDVMLGMGYDQRIGPDFLNPGPGWGGSCFPKDTRALVNIAETGGYDFEMLRSVVEVNEQMFDRMVDKAVELLGVDSPGELAGRRIAVWGLTFKARTDDLRDSPSLEIIDRLNRVGAHVHAFDPAVQRELPGITVHDDAYEAVRDADLLMVLTEWDDFRWLDLGKVAELMGSRRVVDARNVLDRQALRRNHFDYRVVGVPS